MSEQKDVFGNVLGTCRGLFTWVTNSYGRMVGLSIVLILVVVALFSDMLAPYELTEHFGRFLHPSPEHLLGTDDMGRDIFSEIIIGTKLSLEVGFIAATISLTIGVTVGVIAGFYRGRIEQIMLTLTDVTIVIPTLPLLMILVVYFKPGVFSIAIAISIVGWCGMARILHPRTMYLKEQPFVEAAYAIGKSDLYIIIHHIIPNCKEIIAARYALAIGGAMLAESSMAFLGFGDPLNLSWGGIISEAYSNGALGLDLWWWYMAPGILITITILAFMAIGNSKNEDRWVVN